MRSSAKPLAVLSCCAAVVAGLAAGPAGGGALAAGSWHVECPLGTPVEQCLPTDVGAEPAVSLRQLRASASVQPAAEAGEVSPHEAGLIAATSVADSVEASSGAAAGIGSESSGSLQSQGRAEWRRRHRRHRRRGRHGNDDTGSDWRKISHRPESPDRTSGRHGSDDHGSDRRKFSDRPESPDRTMTLYHQTSPEICELILASNFKPGHEGWCGGGIYFATTPWATYDKAIGPDSHQGCILRAEVRVGRSWHLRSQCDRGMVGANLHMRGYDSVEFDPGDGPEYVVYSPSQVLSIERHH